MGEGESVRIFEPDEPIELVAGFVYTGGLCTCGIPLGLLSLANGYVPKKVMICPACGEMHPLLLGPSQNIVAIAYRPHRMDFGKVDKKHREYILEGGLFVLSPGEDLKLFAPVDLDGATSVREYYGYREN